MLGSLARSGREEREGFRVRLEEYRPVVEAVGMWESGAVRRISKERWERWKTVVWFSMVSTAPSFPQPADSSGRYADAWRRSWWNLVNNFRFACCMRRAFSVSLSADRKSTR